MFSSEDPAESPGPLDRLALKTLKNIKSFVEGYKIKKIVFVTKQKKSVLSN